MNKLKVITKPPTNDNSEHNDSIPAHKLALKVTNINKDYISYEAKTIEDARK